MIDMRIIPILLLQNQGFYKSFRFCNYIYLGDPQNIVKIFNDKIVDELVIIDLDGARSAEIYPRNWEYLKKVVSESFSPVVYGGGITAKHEVDRAFALGVEKLVLQRGLLDKTLVDHIVSTYGAQSLIASIDVFEKDGCYFLYDSRSQKIQIDTTLDETIEFVQSIGVGEILVTNVSRDGQFTGLDQNLVRYLSVRSRVPLIVAGGLSSKKCYDNALKNGADAIAGAGMFTLFGPRNAVLITYPSAWCGDENC